MKIPKQILALCLVTGLAGCANMSDTEQRTLSGTGIGAAGGAVIAGLTHGMYWQAQQLAQRSVLPVATCTTATRKHRVINLLRG